jgi:two-component system nitrogen regulation sensor histidine kinase NtrY
VRQVGDIGRMVDEFSAFARMPQPVIRPEEIGRLVREALVLQQHSRPEILWETALPDQPVHANCDRRLINQALTNLLHNAAEGIAMRKPPEDGTPLPQGRIRVSLEPQGEGEGDMLCIAVEDDGVGLPEGDERDRLTEPYVTHKPKGTGLGLAIVKKIMEDHGGRIELRDAPGGQGARAELYLPVRAAAPTWNRPDGAHHGA